MNDKCILCEKACQKTAESGRDGYAVECDTCGRYFLESPELFEQEYIDLPREKRAMISAYTRELFILGRERPGLGDADNLVGIIEKYENKNDEQKVENLILYFRKKSKQFGAEIPIDPEKDYPVSYSLSEQGFLETVKLAKDRDLITEIEKRTLIKLTELGWKQGTEIMKGKTN
jgi:hypothetical protein